MKTKHRNTQFVVEYSSPYYWQAIDSGLMQTYIHKRDGKTVVLPSGKEVVEFINCSYLGLDVHPEVVSAYRNVDMSWGVNFCCARSRFSIAPLQELEEQLSSLYRGRAITFPSVTATHLSVMPLLASGALINQVKSPKICFIFDKFSHASMQYLKPILQQEATVEVISHNSLEELKLSVLCAKSRGEVPIYVADGVYSMGGVCPIRQVLDMAEELDFYLYLDDAHGTTIFGQNGEGAVLSQIEGPLPERIFLAFCLSKGFGAMGGGILVSDRIREHLIRSYGLIYAFSACMDFASVNAALSVLKLHRDGTVKKLNKTLRDRVSLYDKLTQQNLPFSPIRMIEVRSEDRAIEMGKKLIERGYFVSVVFFPVVPKQKAQLRICISANHTEAQITGLVQAIKEVQAETSQYSTQFYEQAHAVFA